MAAACEPLIDLGRSLHAGPVARLKPRTLLDRRFHALTIDIECQSDIRISFMGRRRGDDANRCGAHCPLARVSGPEAFLRFGCAPKRPKPDLPDVSLGSDPDPQIRQSVCP